jgi:hypothetical protein
MRSRILPLLRWLLAGYCLSCGVMLWADTTLPAEFDDVVIEEMGPLMPSTLPRDASLELPEWKLDDVREFDENNAPLNHGGGLWPSQLWPLMPVPSRLPMLDSGQAPGNPPMMITGDAVEPISPALQEIYFGKIPPEVVVDPQSLLNEVQQEDLCRFFDEYALRQAGVKVRLLVLGPNQEVPPAPKLQALTERWFEQELGLVVVYPFGQPKASACYFSPALQLTYTPDQLNAVREASVKEAMFATREEDQLSRFGIKLAVRMNRLHDEPKLTLPATVALARDPVPAWLIRSALSVLAALLVVGTTLALVRWNRRRPHTPVEAESWLLPDQEMTTRLSAPHCGGTMAILKFR